MIHHSTLSTPQPWIDWRGGGFWDVSSRIRGKGGCLFFKPPSLSGNAREMGLAFCSPVALLPERGIPVFPNIISFFLLCFNSLVRKTSQTCKYRRSHKPRPVFSLLENFALQSTFEQTITPVNVQNFKRISGLFGLVTISSTCLSLTPGVVA